MLAFNVAQLLKEGIGATRHYELSGELYDIDEQNAGPVPVEGHLDVVRIPRGLLAQGKAHLAMAATCRRCLATYEREVDLDIEEEYVATVDVVTGYRIELAEGEDEEPELLISDHHILDTREVLRQYAVATIIDAGLCRPDCRGICPICGADLNHESCNCHLAQVDPRLAALAGLLDSTD